MIKIRQGTTTTITVNIPEDIDISTITEAWLYIKFDELQLDKVLDDMLVDEEENRFLCPLTQEETLALPLGYRGFIQIRMLDENGAAYTSDPLVPVLIEEAYKKGVIGND